MANDLNQCQFIGRLGKDPETRYTASGDAVANFSIACSESWKDKTSGQKVEKTEWVNCVAFKKLAEIIGEYLKKGSQVYVSGKMQTRKWQDKSGNDRWSTEVVVKDMQMIGSRDSSAAVTDSVHTGYSASAPQGQQQAPQQQQQQAAPSWDVDDFDSDISF